MSAERGNLQFGELDQYVSLDTKCIFRYKMY
jgi:hypothetical protein